MELKDKNILITGGTGSLGKALVEALSPEQPRKIIIFSRDELKQSQMSGPDCLRFFLGNVRDSQRLEQVFQGVDIVIHAAALKQIPKLEYNPTEAVKTNVDGSMNVINACIKCEVERAILISTDKAVNPINLYGATKLCAEKLFLAANYYNKTGFSVVRYGNVINSRGSVIEKFLALGDNDQFPITNPEMTRFWITLEDAAKLVLYALTLDKDYIYVPEMPSMSILNIAKTIKPDCRLKTIGIRPGEKLHETLISEDKDKVRVVSQDFKSWHKAGFKCSSDANHLWMTPEELRRELGI